jgi:hypothetical protein
MWRMWDCAVWQLKLIEPQNPGSGRRRLAAGSLHGCCASVGRRNYGKGTAIADTRSGYGGLMAAVRLLGTSQRPGRPKAVVIPGNRRQSTNYSGSAGSLQRSGILKSTKPGGENHRALALFQLLAAGRNWLLTAPGWARYGIRLARPPNQDDRKPKGGLPARKLFGIR